MKRLQCRAMLLNRRFYFLPTIIRTDIGDFVQYSIAWLNMSIEFWIAEDECI